MTLCSFLPTILLRFIAGAVAGRCDKKQVKLLADFVAACGTMTILLMHSASALKITHLDVINFLMSCMNAFQVPAAYVATSLLVPEEYYSRADGLQAAGNAAVSILSPALGGMLLLWNGMQAVLLIDLATFAIAFAALLFIRIPRIEQSAKAAGESLFQNCLTGFRFLNAHRRILRLILFIAAVNFLPKLGADGLMSVFILSRTNGNQTALGMVQSAVAMGILAGGMLAAAAKQKADSVKTVFVMCSLIFSVGLVMAVSRSVAGWSATAVLQYLFAAVMNVHWNTVMRSAVPIQMQGRVFSTRDTLQNCTIPLGIYLGGILADHIFEPLMTNDSAVRQALSVVFGAGNGAGIAVQFFLTSASGLMLSIVCMYRKQFRDET